jgi:hypothetical protein
MLIKVPLIVSFVRRSLIVGLASFSANESAAWVTVIPEPNSPTAIIDRIIDFINPPDNSVA